MPNWASIVADTVTRQTSDARIPNTRILTLVCGDDGQRYGNFSPHELQAARRNRRKPERDRSRKNYSVMATVF